MIYQTLNNFQSTYGRILGSYTGQRLENIPFGGITTRVRFYIIVAIFFHYLLVLLFLQIIISTCVRSTPATLAQKFACLAKKIATEELFISSSLTLSFRLA